MIHGTLTEVATQLDTHWAGRADLSYSGVSTDTRTLAPGNLFVALDGPNHAGRDFIANARDAGAAAALTSVPVDDPLPQLVTGDTRAALAVLARNWRLRHSPQVIGITGSNGKTTTRSMVAACCGEHTLATEGNLNNDIGVPLTLFRLDASHRRAVIEMGANHQREIAALAAIAVPSIGIVTNAGPAHLEGFGGIDGVAKGKGELYQALGRGDVAVINNDDVYAPLWREFAEPATIRSFGSSADADVWFDRFEQIDGNAISLRINVADDAVDVRLGLGGRHNAMNATGAAAVALAAGIPLGRIAERLGGVQAEPGRQRTVAGVHGARIIDDSYNANPASMRAGAETLVSVGGETWMAIGDMGELGDDAREMHASLGRALADIGVDRLFTVGVLSAAAAEAFGTGAKHFETIDALAEALASALRPGVTVLVKGSRSARMERVVARLTVTEEAC